MTKENEESPLDHDLRWFKNIGTTFGALSILGTVASTSPADTKTATTNERTTTIATDLAPRSKQPTQPDSGKKTTRYMETITEQRLRERKPSGQEIG